ncbi:MAG: GNAT family N-acetyltransferase [Aestuariivita sp.]|nr:GNAT family N-acetyltransferase [Aestuariivita sp.]
MTQLQTEIEIHSSLKSITESDWDLCACPEALQDERPFDPFTTYRFLKALENSGSVGGNTGWQPQYLTAKNENILMGVAPLYVKYHSQGEYIFDHNWAYAYEGAGGQYYPKLQMAVPFTPVTGRRLLVRSKFAEPAQSALIASAIKLAERTNLSSFHITFCTEEEIACGHQLGLMHRVGQQFHWEDNSYQNFDDFLLSLSSRKRKNIRKERTQANDFTGTIEVLTGDDIKSCHWDAFWTFYRDTGARKWGVPYLTRGFFEEIHAHMRKDVVLIMARNPDGYFAGALNFVGRETLFGRYWGCTKYQPCLHFELCYYQAIEWALAAGLTRVEAGAQGQHKLARGYMPKQVHSLHWVSQPNFSDAISRFLEAERQAIGEDIEILTEYGPFKTIEVEEYQ